MKQKFLISLLILVLHISPKALFSQNGLQPGFDPMEYTDLLKLNFKAMPDSLEIGTNYKLSRGNYKKLFRSPEVGLYNRCEVFLRNDHVAVISIRGTIAKPQSWLENFYAGMVSANGQLQINDSTVFNYKLSNNDKALVHIGWLVGLGHLAPYINAQLEPLLAKGINQVIVMGHSQGGALSFLTTSYLWYKYHEQYPNLKLKTYASAAPKPGNLYYAYDFDFITKNGYGYRVVNSADWVPESPITIQTMDDFNDVNPFMDINKLLENQKLIIRLAVDHMYNKLNNGSNKAMRRYRKFLGTKMYKEVKRTLTQYKAPAYAYSSYYMTAGSPIILIADSTYYDTFKFDGKNLFIHHMLPPYLYLVNQYYPLEYIE